MSHVHRFKIRDGSEYKFCRCGKRKAVRSIIRERRALQRKAEDLWRQICHKRDGPGCQIQKKFPEFNLHHSGQMQVDHFFPRADRNLYFEVSNGTVICSYCNYLKSNGSSRSTIISIAVKEIVVQREGEAKYKAMFDINNRREPNREWGREEYLKQVIANLEAYN